MSVSRRIGSFLSVPTLVLLLCTAPASNALCAERAPSRSRTLETLVVGYGGSSDARIQLAQLETPRGKERYEITLTQGGRTLAHRRVIREVYERLHEGIGDIARRVARRAPASDRCERKLVGQWSAVRSRPGRLDVCLDQVGDQRRQDVQAWFDGAFAIVSR